MCPLLMFATAFPLIMSFLRRPLGPHPAYHFPVHEYRAIEANSDQVVAIISNRLQRQVVFTERLDEGRLRYCDVCEAVQPDRAQHCSLCSVCVMRRDHHNLFIGNCVGAHNHRYFIQMLLYLVMYCLFTAVAGVTALFIYIPQVRHSFSSQTNHKLTIYGR